MNSLGIAGGGIVCEYFTGIFDGKYSANGVASLLDMPSLLGASLHVVLVVDAFLIAFSKPQTGHFE